MKKLIFIICSLIIVNTACEKDKPAIQETDDIFGFTSIEEARQYLGNYADIFAAANGSMYIRLTSYISGKHEQGEIFARYNETLSLPRSDGGIFGIGKMELVFDESTKTYVPINGPFDNKQKARKIKELFGTNQDFYVMRNGKEIIKFNMYLPELLHVELPGTSKYKNESLRAMRRNDFKLEWNQDENNHIGIVAYVWWNGDRIDLPVYEQGHGEVINKAVKLPDTGQGKISSEIFDGIPANAIVSLFVMRGNVNKKENNGEVFNFYSISQVKYNIVLTD